MAPWSDLWLAAFWGSAPAAATDQLLPLSKLSRRCHGRIKRDFTSQLSALEIYNGTVVDLLNREFGTEGSLKPSSSPKGVEVRAVMTIRKKMKEKLTEKMEDQWEFFGNGIGQGIQIQLVSEEVDPAYPDVDKEMERSRRYI